MTENVNKCLSKFAIDTMYSDIPDSVRYFAKCLTLKTVAGMLAGSTKPSGQKMTKIIRDQSLPQEVGVVGTGLKTTLWLGAFLNAYLAHASELEDDRFKLGVSWDITVIPLLLSLAEKIGISGRSLLEALVVGLEVHTRTCYFSADHLGLYNVPGAVGPAIGAARLENFNEEQTAAAIGLSLSAPPLSMVNLGTDAHFFESSLMVLQAAMATDMAKAGLAGNPDVANYLTAFLGEERVTPHEMIKDIGTSWILQEIQIKKYPCCLAMHRHIDLVLEMKKKYDLSMDKIEQIEVHSRRQGDIRCNRPEPKNANDLQFSFQHTLSTAMLDGDVGLEHFTPECVDEPRLIEARKKVKFLPSDNPVPTLGDSVTDFPAQVVIKTKDGEQFSKERKYAIGSIHEPLSTEQFLNLYRKFCRNVLSKKDVSRSSELIMNMENLSDTRELMAIITGVNNAQ